MNDPLLNFRGNGWAAAFLLSGGDAVVLVGNQRLVPAQNSLRRPRGVNERQEELVQFLALSRQPPAFIIRQVGTFLSRGFCIFLPVNSKLLFLELKCRLEIDYDLACVIVLHAFHKRIQVIRSDIGFCRLLGFL